MYSSFRDNALQALSSTTVDITTSLLKAAAQAASGDLCVYLVQSRAETVLAPLFCMQAPKIGYGGLESGRIELNNKCLKHLRCRLSKSPLCLVGITRQARHIKIEEFPAGLLEVSACVIGTVKLLHQVSIA